MPGASTLEVMATSRYTLTGKVDGYGVRGYANCYLGLLRACYRLALPSEQPSQRCTKALLDGLFDPFDLVFFLELLPHLGELGVLLLQIL